MLIVPESVTSERLALNRVVKGDLDAYCSLFQNPDVMSHLGPADSTSEQTAARLDRHVGYWEEHGVGPWSARLLESGQFVGMGGLQRVECLGQEEISVGYALVPEFWGQGFAAEIASTACSIGFNKIAIGSIVSITMPENVGSQRVMEKVGFTFECELLHAGLQQLLYRLLNPNHHNVL